MKLGVLLVVSLGLATTAHADDATTLPAPGTSYDLRIGIPATFSDTGVVVGLANFQLGVGQRVSGRWYVGGTAEWMLGMNIGPTVVTSSLRLGGEARYIFHQGTAEVSTSGEDGPYYPTPRYDWFGLRGGVQTIGSARGGFAELAIGFDANVTETTRFGAYLAAGLNLEPPGAYGVQDPADGPVPALSTSSVVASPYVVIGWDITFG
jgi:hypothetical protein